MASDQVNDHDLDARDARHALSRLVEADAVRLASRTRDQAMMRAILADGRESLAEALAANPLTPDAVVAALFRGPHRGAKMTALRTHFGGAEVDLARHVCESDDLEVVTSYALTLAARHAAHLGDDAVTALGLTSGGLHAVVWNLLEARGQLFNREHVSLSAGARAVFLFLASVPGSRRWARQASLIAARINAS